MKKILVEILTLNDCPENKEKDFTAAFKPYLDAGTGIEIKAHYLGAHNHNDYTKRYVQFYNNPGTQAPRYMGLFGTRVAIGSLWYDAIGGSGVYNMEAGTKEKIDSMLATENGFELTATKTETNGLVKVSVTGKAPKQTRCLLIVLLIDADNNFKQVLIEKEITVPKIQKTISVKGTTEYPGSRVIVLIQDKNMYTPDGSNWGSYQHEVFCVTEAKAGL